MEGRAPGSPAGVRGLGEVKQRLSQAGCPCITLLQIECLRGLPLSGRVGRPYPPPPLPLRRWASPARACPLPLRRRPPLPPLPPSPPFAAA